jgi:N-formylglutamate amidohydrolase
LSRPLALALIRGFILSLVVTVPACASEAEAAERFLKVQSGMLPIILAAPHGGRESIPGVAVRRGAGVAQFTTGRDHNTSELAELIAAKLHETLAAKPFLVIAQFDRKFIDANRPSEAAYETAEARPYYDNYHLALRGHCEKVRALWGQGLLLDIHGQNSEAHAIFRGTNNLKSVADLQRRFGDAALSGAKSILGYLARSGYKVIPSNDAGEREQRYSGGFTTRTYGSHRGTGVDAIQLEFGFQLRSRGNLERTAADVTRAIAVFAAEYLPLKAALSKGSE